MIFWLQEEAMATTKVKEVRRVQNGCKHLDVELTHAGDRINRLECQNPSCNYVFFMDHELYDRFKDRLHRKYKRSA